MTKKEALAEARRRFGPKGYVQINRKVIHKAADRAQARVAVRQLRATKPIRPDFTKATDDDKRAYWKVNREFVERESFLMSIIWSHRCDVGSIMEILGAFHVRGSGDTFEEAFADVDKKDSDRLAS